MYGNASWGRNACNRIIFALHGKYKMPLTHIAQYEIFWLLTPTPGNCELNVWKRQTADFYLEVVPIKSQVTLIECVGNYNITVPARNGRFFKQQCSVSSAINVD